jgi:hypothetical protein
MELESARAWHFYQLSEGLPLDLKVIGWQIHGQDNTRTQHFLQTKHGQMLIF